VDGLVRIGIRERLEVVHANEAGCEIAHPIHIEVVLHPPDEGLGESGAASCDLIDVAAPLKRSVTGFMRDNDAIARSYIYQIRTTPHRFAKPFVWWVKDDLDVDRMRDLAARFVGMHDFQSFSDADPDESSTHVLVETLDVHEDGDLIVVHVEGSHFIWKMVRRLVGILVEVGRGGCHRRRPSRC